MLTPEQRRRVDERRAYITEARATIAADPVGLQDLILEEIEQCCAGCGCSDMVACPERCGWAEYGLCTACAHDGVRVVDVRITEDEAREVALFLAASVADYAPSVRARWDASPVGMFFAALGRTLPIRHELGCPDGGACHHSCKTSCWRVVHALPLSAAKYPDDRWPADVVDAHPPDLGDRSIETRLVGTAPSRAHLSVDQQRALDEAEDAPILGLQ